MYGVDGFMVEQYVSIKPYTYLESSIQLGISDVDLGLESF